MDARYGLSEHFTRYIFAKLFVITTILKLNSCGAATNQNLSSDIRSIRVLVRKYRMQILSTRNYYKADLSK